MSTSMASTSTQQEVRAASKGFISIEVLPETDMCYTHEARQFVDLCFRRHPRAIDKQAKTCKSLAEEGSWKLGIWPHQLPPGPIGVGLAQHLASKQAVRGSPGKTPKPQPQPTPKPQRRHGCSTL